MLHADAWVCVHKCLVSLDFRLHADSVCWTSLGIEPRSIYIFITYHQAIYIYIYIYIYIVFLIILIFLIFQNARARVTSARAFFKKSDFPVTILYIFVFARAQWPLRGLWQAFKKILKKPELLVTISRYFGVCDYICVCAYMRACIRYMCVGVEKRLLTN